MYPIENQGRRMLLSLGGQQASHESYNLSLNANLNVERKEYQPSEQIWKSAKMLEYTTSSILRRLTLSYKEAPAIALTALSSSLVDKMIESVFQVFDEELAEKRLTFKVQMTS